VRAQWEAALAAVSAVVDWPDDESREAARLIKERRTAVNQTINRLAKAAAGTLKTRTHGDFHLGQVLVSSGDAYIIDFEGEPARALEERRAKSSPLRDVAGLLRSFDYAVAAAASRAEGPTQNAPSKATVLDRFAVDAAEAFLAAYRAVHAESPAHWATEASEPALLDLFLIEKAAYEICYEAANRPGWIGIPLHGLARIVARLTTPVMEAADG
jgi:maltose alpha-D-glucosyltransferase/alpha-amylase